jgi:hypothetical protein
MKKTILLHQFLLVLIIITAPLYAQIPNSGFEQWDQGEPIDWITSNEWFLNTVSQTASSHSGLSALKLQTLSMNEFLIPAIISAGTDGYGFPVSQRHEQLSFYYKFNKTASTAYFYIAVGFKKNGETIGAEFITITEASDDFVALNIPITYLSTEVPDSAVIVMQVADQVSDTSASGSYAVIDDISFNVVSDVEKDDVKLSDFNLAQNYPNPFNPSTKISWQSPVGSHQTLKVYDIIGNEVAILVDEYKPAGSYVVEFDASNLSSGVYLYQLKSNSKMITKKMTLIK